MAPAPVVSITPLVVAMPVVEYEPVVCTIAAGNETAPVPGAVGEHAGRVSVNFRFWMLTFSTWQNGPMQKKLNTKVVLAKFNCSALTWVEVNGGAAVRYTAVAVPVVGIVRMSSSVLVPRVVWMVMMMRT